MKKRPPFNPNDPRLDSQVRHLCTALNRLPGILTTESCCGHGRAPFRIWFHVTDHSKRGFVAIARFTCPRYYRYDWRVLLDHSDMPDTQAGFLLESKKLGRASYRAAERLARVIDEHVERKTNGYNILFDRRDTLPRSRRQPRSCPRRRSGATTR